MSPTHKERMYPFTKVTYASLILNNYDTKSKNFTSFIYQGGKNHSGFPPDVNILSHFYQQDIWYLTLLLFQHSLLCKIFKISHLGTCAYGQLRCKQMYWYLTYMGPTAKRPLRRTEFSMVHLPNTKWTMVHGGERLFEYDLQMLLIKLPINLVLLK